MAIDHECARNAKLLRAYILTLYLSPSLLASFSGKIKVIKTKSNVRSLKLYETHEGQLKNKITFTYYFSLLLSYIVDCKPNLNSRVQQTK